MSAMSSVVPDLTPSELDILLTAAMPARKPVIVTGAPGVGKTQIIRQVTARLGFNLVLSHPAVEDPTVPAGFPFPSPDGTHATFLPFGNTFKVLQADGGPITVWFLDDFGQATNATQAGYMQFLLGGQLGEHKLPDNVVMILATNRRIDRANVGGILETVKSRAVTIVNLVPDLNDWCIWAFANGIDPILIAFLRFRPDLLCAFEPTADLTNSPLPRTWENFNEILSWGLPKGLRSKALGGSTGVPATTEYEAFESMFKQLPNIDGILLDPDNAKIPDSPGALYAVTTALASKVNVSNFGRIIRYGERLMDAMHGEFAALLMRDCTRRDPDVENTTDFTRMISGDLGGLIGGAL